jgi:predicted RNA-binding Zn ribbon-like protein
VVTKRATELLIVGGDPALDLANTLGGSPGETLVDYAELSAWAARVGVVGRDEAARLTALGEAHPSAADTALTAARELRTLVDGVFRPLATGGEPAPEALDGLLARGAEATARARLRRHDGSFELAWDGDDLERVVWPLAAAAVDLLRRGALDSLKLCQGCPWLFLDTSRNRSRRWCSMNVCGGAAKMRRYRARRATAGR